MNYLTNGSDLRMSPFEDRLDQALSDFFRSRMQHPWPAAPATLTGGRESEPASILVLQNAVGSAPSQELQTQTSQLAPSLRDSGGKSRFTLAASVALLLGTSWYLSNAFQAGSETAAPRVTTQGLRVLPDAVAEKPEVLKQQRRDEAEGGNPHLPPALKAPLN